MLQCSKSIPSTEENNYLCGGVNYEEDAAKESIRTVPKSAEVIIFLSADFSLNTLGASLNVGLKDKGLLERGVHRTFTVQ